MDGARRETRGREGRGDAGGVNPKLVEWLFSVDFDFNALEESR